MRSAGGDAGLRLINTGALTCDVAVGRAASGDLREKFRACGGNQRARLFQLRRRRNEILVVRQRERLQPVQFCVAEQLPPFTARHVSGWLRDFPNDLIGAAIAESFWR